MSRVWSASTFGTPANFAKLHNPAIFADSFGLKRPQFFCANEDCIYLKEKRCPAGAGKESCPNKSSLDYRDGCPHFYGKPYQHTTVQDIVDAKNQIAVIVTGRGTGKSAILHTQPTLMDMITEPYIRAMLSKSDRPVPTLVLVIGNTKDTAMMLRNHIHNAIDGSEKLSDQIAEKTRTYIRCKNGSECHIDTAGVDGSNIRGHHANVMKNIKNEFVKTTIKWKFDEACFARAKRVISEIMRPSLQVGNCFSNITVTTTPGPKEGEIWDLYSNPGTVVGGQMVGTYNFAAYHNRFTNLDLLFDFRDRMVRSGQSGIYNREVLGLFQSDEGLFFPLFIWNISVDDRLDWVTYEEIEKIDVVLPGTYYLAIDPNKFLQSDAGDFAAYTLLQVGGHHEFVRAISYGKYQLDIEDKFIDRIMTIVRKFNPVVSVDENSGYYAKLRNLGIDARKGSNSFQNLFRSLSVLKLDMVDGVFKQPSSNEIEDERKTFFIKDPSQTGSSRQKIEHKGDWGQGYTDDVIKTLSYNYQQIIEDYGLDGLVDVAVGSNNGYPAEEEYSAGKVESSIDAILKSSTSRMNRIN